MSGSKPMGGARMGGSGGMGGFGGGDSFGEASDENNAMNSIAAKMGNSGNSSSSSSGSSGLGGNGSGNGSGSGSSLGGLPQQPPVEPREVGSISDEAKRGVEDAWLEVKKFFLINTWLGINPENLTPEEQAQAKEFHGRYQHLDQEQQAVARQMYQEQMQKKKIQADEDRRKKEIEAQKNEQSIVMPTGPQRGAEGPGGKSKKQQVMHKLKQDRTTLSTSQGE